MIVETDPALRYDPPPGVRAFVGDVEKDPALRSRVCGVLTAHLRHGRLIVAHLSPDCSHFSAARTTSPRDVAGGLRCARARLVLIAAPKSNGLVPAL